MRQRQSIGVLMLGLALVWSGAVRAQEVAPPENYRLRLEYDQWAPTLNATLQIGGEGSEVDVKSDLGLEDKKLRPISGALQLSRGVKLRGSYTSLDYRGDRKVSRDFTFEGTSYQVSERVVSSLKGKYYTADLELDIIKTTSGFIGLMVGAQVFDVQATLDVPAVGKHEETSQQLPIPVIGAAGRLYFGRLSVGGEISGLSIGKRGHVYEAAGGAGLHISDRLAIRGGYRSVRLHGEKEPDLIDFKMEGWTFGVELSL